MIWLAYAFADVLVLVGLGFIVWAIRGRSHR